MAVHLNLSVMRQLLMIRLILSLLTFLLACRASADEPKISTRPENKPAKSPVATTPYSTDFVKEILADAKAHGDSRRGAGVFGSPTLACLSCHTVAGKGGTVGPDLSNIGRCLPPNEIV